MTDKHDDGGPAYPSLRKRLPGYDDVYDVISEGGMSLWDAAALAALTGLCAGQTSDNLEQVMAQTRAEGKPRTYYLAKTAFDIADAFIKERRKRESGDD